MAALLNIKSNVYIIEAMFFLILLFIGIINPASSTLALSLERKTAGNASAIMGFTAFLFGGIVSPLVGIGNVRISTAVVLIVCSFASASLAFWAMNTKVATDK